MEPFQHQRLARWNPVRDVWETDQASLFCEHSDVFSETLPPSGSMRSGVLYRRPMSAQPTTDSGFSSRPGLLPTPVAAEGIKPSNTMGVARRRTTGQVFLTNVMVTLNGLDPSEKRLPTPKVSDRKGPGKRGEGSPDLRTVTMTKLLPTPRATRGGSGTETVRLLPTPTAHPSGNSPEDHLRKKPGRTVVTDLKIVAEHGLLATGGRLPASEVDDTSPTNWGEYGAAVRLHERVLGRPVPPPIGPTAKGGLGLSARFVEWLMMLPEGWITDIITNRNDALKLLGNGVVPLQALRALQLMEET